MALAHLLMFCTLATLLSYLYVPSHPLTQLFHEYSILNLNSLLLGINILRCYLRLCRHKTMPHLYLMYLGSKNHRAEMYTALKYKNH